MQVSGNPWGLPALLVVIVFTAGPAVLIWTAIASLLAGFAGWPALQRRYAANALPKMVVLRMCSAQMGFGVQLRAMLTLRAGPEGIGIAPLRIFMPLQRPILVPWQEISAVQRTGLLARSARLHFGRPVIGAMTMRTATWARLVAAAPQGWRG